jgi:drug/metabolite transporter (DMT)-like permease
MFDLRLLFVTVVWGVNFAVVKFALTDFLPLSFTIVRFFTAALFLTGVMYVTKEPFAIERRDRLAIVKLGFIGITLYNIFFMYGLKYTTASHSALFISLSPLFAVLFQARTGKEHLTGSIALGLLLASTGVYLVISGRHDGINFSAFGLTGDLLTLCASVLWALYTLNAEPLLEKYSAIKITAYCMATGSVLLFPIGLHELIGQSWSSISPQSWAAFGFSTIVSAGIAFSLWYQGVRRIGVTRTIAYHYLVPFVAVVFAVLFLGEHVTLFQIAGGIAIIGGVAVVQGIRIR